MSTVRQKKSARVATGFVVIAALLLAGCGADDTTPDANTGTSAQATGPSAQGPSKPAKVTVRVDDMSFSPADITVKVGDTVTWKFDDRFPHSVQGIGDDAMGLNSPIYTQGGEWSYTFIADGTYRYLCSLHPEMRGTVTVE